MRPTTVHNYSFTFPFEDTFDFAPHHQWLQQNWTHSFYYAAIYVIVIFALKKFMERRKRFELRAPLIFWNAGLALFSVMGATRLGAEMVTILTHDGFYHTMCNSSAAWSNGVSAYWLWLMWMSKVVELGDTVFIVLRKKPLIFLHWYHHITVLIYTWMSCAGLMSTGRWFGTVNLAVHAIMYSYYTLKAMRFRPPKRIAMVITVLQLAQMVMGVCVNLKARQLLQDGVECQTTMANVNAALMLYASYFILFVKFFYSTYLEKKEITSIPKSKSQ